MIDPPQPVTSFGIPFYYLFFFSSFFCVIILFADGGERLKRRELLHSSIFPSSHVQGTTTESSIDRHPSAAAKNKWAASIRDADGARGISQSVPEIQPHREKEKEKERDTKATTT